MDVGLVLRLFKKKKKEDSPAPLAGMRLRQHRDSALGADKTDNLGLKV